MNVYDAIMKAADHIERYPREFDFNEVDVPREPHCGTPGCAVGWIGYFLKCDDLFATAELMGLKNEGYIYEALMEFDEAWSINAQRCSRALRLYAAKYYAPKPAVVPDWNALAAIQTVPQELVA